MISRLPPTYFIGEKSPSKVKFQSALECVGVDLELRFKKLPSILYPNKCVEINCIHLTCKLTPTEVKNFLARFSTFENFFKNVLEYQNCSKFARRPNSTYFSIWVKNWGSEKVGNSLFSGPKLDICTVFDALRRLYRILTSGDLVWLQNLQCYDIFTKCNNSFLDKST